MAKFYAPTCGEISEREKTHMDFIRKAAPECVVLLENDGALPLKQTGKIALYGNGVRMTVKGGTGSGDVNSRMVINVEQGFEEAGFTVTTKDWLDTYTDQVAQAKQEYFEKMNKAAQEQGMPMIALALSMPFKDPEAGLVSDEQIQASDTDTAIYVIARNSGEGADRFNTAGDYLLTETELANLTKLAAAYKKFIVILNVGGVIDTTAIKNIDGINALVLMSQLGNIGGYAIVDALCGRTMPSGKLTTTWAAAYADYPSSDEFSHNNGDTEEGYYTEGIYVGYRYFDTFNITPNYCFGYGLSYTDFNIEVLSTKADAQTVSVEVKVTNTGKEHAGKEVVQVYYSAPDGRLEKPYQELAAYGKTDLLAPGESQTMTISFKTSAMASYCDKCASWVLEPGKYYIRVGNSSRNTKIAAAVDLSKRAKVEQLKNLFADTVELELLSRNGHAPYTYDGEAEEMAAAPVIALDASEIITKEAVYEDGKKAVGPVNTERKTTMDDVMAGRTSLDDLIAELTVEEMTEICVGTSRGISGRSIVGAASANVPGAAGDTTSLLLEDRNIRNIILADGPAGLRLTPVFSTTADGQMLQSEMMMGDVKLVEGEAIPEDAVTYYQYCTAIPIGTALAQSWNLELIEAVGSIVGKEMEDFNVHLWLAPAMNIHRNPLCGRNFEYYSEDPLVAGLSAAADTLGVQSHAGVGTTIKHFAANSQEDDRYFTNAHVSERAIREIYLKGFEIAVKTSQPMSIMSSYNLLNGTHTANSYELLTSVARDEWGFGGLVMTDWFTTQDISFLVGNKKFKYGNSSPAQCIKAGNDLIMPGGETDITGILAAVESGELTVGELQDCVRHILGIVMKSSCYAGAKPYGEHFDSLDWAVKVEK